MDATDAGSAELVVLNSCTVTAQADRDLEYAVRRSRRENPQARVLVTGCYAQRDPERLAALEGVDWVIGNSHKDRLAELLSETEPTFHTQIHVSDIFSRREFFSAPIEDAPDGRARPNLKIQDGCNNRCSFCIIPSVRGASRSAPADEVVERVRRLSATHPEIVLTGVNLGRWGRELGQGRALVQLLRRLLDETDIARLRLSSIEPMDWTDDLIELVAINRRIAKHVHAPLQSGSDAVLRRMFRKYRPRHYRDRIERAYAAIPQAAFGADVMTGFPGETDAEFEESFDFIDSLPFTYLHVFSYSPRPGTRATELPQIASDVQKERTRRLRELSDRKNLAFRKSLIGQCVEVVTLYTQQGMTSNFVTVDLAAPTPPHRLRTVTVSRLSDSGVAEAPLLPVLT